MTLAISPFTMPAALAAADSIISDPAWSGNPAIWSADPANSEQVAWIKSFRRRAIIAHSISEIRRNATTSPDNHVAWLRAEGWDAQISRGEPLDIFLAATLNIVAKWRKVGIPRVEEGVDRVLLRAEAYTSRISTERHSVVEVLTQHDGFSFCFQQVDEAPTDRTALAAMALSMVSRDACEEVCLDFPMVDLRVRDDARYMIGLRSGPNIVTQAAEQLRLELNEVGGRASAAAEVAVSRGSGPRTIRIDGPFIVAINRNGAPVDEDKVVFAAYCNRSCWRRPADGRMPGSP